MSMTKIALELGIDLVSIQEYLEDDVLPEYYENHDQYTQAVKFVKWAKNLHANNELLKLGITPEALPYLEKLAIEFVCELDDEHDYIEHAEMLLNYYRQAWAFENPPVPRFNVRKHADLIRERILLERGL